MNRMLLAAAACLVAGAARADWGMPPAMPAPGYPAPPPAAEPPDRFGWHPVLRKALWWNHKDPCHRGLFGHKGCGHGFGHGFGLGHGGGGAGMAAVPPPPGVYPNMTGTLVFPRHQFNRSPRDFFMHDVR